MRLSVKRIPNRNRSRKPRKSGTSKRRSTRAEAEILELVRSGVEKFILNNATVEDFLKTIREVTEKERIYSHQLTRSVLSKIVKDAIKKRNLSQPK